VLIESKRSFAIKPIPAIEIKRKCAELISQGERIIDLSIGDTDFAAPPSFLSGLTDAFEKGLTHYTASQGIPELRDRIGKNYGVTKEEVLISAGGKEGIFSLFLSLVGEGDEVLFPEPAWPPVRAYTQLCGGRPIAVKAKIGNEFIPTLQEFREKVSPRTKLVVINSPNNPTGAVYPTGLVRGLAEMADELGFILLSDEIYSNYDYSGDFATALGCGENVVVLDGFSKTFGLTGIRLCYLVGNNKLIRMVNKIHGYNMGNAPSLSQHAAISIMDERDYMMGNRDEMRDRIEMAHDILKDTPGISIYMPKGAFYMLPEYHVNLNSVELANDMLRKKKVAVVPGIGFGAGRSFRIAFSQPKSIIKEGIIKIREYFREA